MELLTRLTSIEITEQPRRRQPERSLTASEWEVIDHHVEEALAALGALAWLKQETEARLSEL
jgi:hypothetical protein